MTGKVYLVGSGPGDYKLITVKGKELLAEADTIVYDRLANDRLLSFAKPDVEKIYVGKKSNQHTMKQDEINKTLVKCALEGKMVVRLKGGDPFVFGRGGEEIIELNKYDIPFEVVPGISSSIGGLAYAGIPITHRNVATSFHVVTGHLMEGGEELEWDALAKVKGTLVFLMGMANIDKISKNLMEYGKSGETPCAIIQWASRANQRVERGTLGNIVDVVKQTGISSPALIVIGDVVNLREALSFYEERPLFGKSVMVTRAKSQNSSLLDSIEALGGRALEYPTIKIEKSDDKELEVAINTLASFEYIVFSSVNGVEVFFEKLLSMGKDARALSGTKIVAIGPSTGKTIKKYGINPDLIPPKYVAESVVDTLKPHLKGGERILLPRANNARRLLIDALNEVAEVIEVITYESVIDDSDLDYTESDIDYITFTSASTVKNFVEKIGKENVGLYSHCKMLSIGPVTSRTMREEGLTVYKEASVSTIDGMLDLLLGDN